LKLCDADDDGVSMGIEFDEPCWSVIIEADTNSGIAVGTPLSLCLFAAGVVEPVLCL